MKEIVQIHDFFLNVPLQISTTGHKPTRGIYKRCIFRSSEHKWFDNKLNEILDLNWILELDRSYVEYLSNF